MFWNWCTFVSAFLLLIGLHGHSKGEVVIADPIPSARVPLSEVCLTSQSSISMPKIGTLSGIPAVKAKDVNNPPVFKHAIIELELLDFNKNVPAEVRIFDNTTGQLIDNIKFKPLLSPCVSNETLPVPIFLAYDRKPWTKSNTEPLSPITRIEVYMPTLGQSETAYAKLKDGTFVVPVVWHDIAEFENGGQVYVDKDYVKDLFWSIPSGNYEDVNSIWAQAGIQIRLISLNIPFHLNSIPTHLVKSPDKSNASNCLPGWQKSFSDTEGVDLYAVYRLSFLGGDAHGVGNCFGQGHIFIKAGNPNGLNPGFTDKLTGPGGRAWLVAHEFGHYLGYLNHEDTIWNNLMSSGADGWKLEQYQIDLARDRLKKNVVQHGGYNEKK